ncbi:MAG: ribosomal protein S18-alanine N-acetyltransferase [Coleofasciculus sp. G3-WIS-01]|uniref:ribosomal protein S18-alanine N-acetyltransferase n=1 Tax=Coleofasciculus sp. G3-WIS-01 TaxID=3069528 RepID=UPI0032F1812C
MTVLELKPLTTAKLSAAVDLDLVCFGGLWTRSGYERELNSPNSQLLVLEAHNPWDKRPVGCHSAVVRPQNPLGEDLPTHPPLGNALVGLGCYWSILEEAHITILAVHPNYQHQGLGQFLLYALLKDAKQRQLEWATLEVKPSNHAALSLYQKFDFIPAGRRRGYYQDTGEDALILWRKGLQQPEFEQTLQECYEQIVSRLTRQGWQLFSYV